MAMLLVMRLLAEIKVAISCKCERLSASVKPENQNEKKDNIKKEKKKNQS